MSTPITPPPADELIEVLRHQLEAQPWYKRFANTVTGIIGAITVAIWLAASAGLELPSEVTKWITLGIVVATVLGLYKTPNGTTPREVENLENLAGYLGRHRSP